MKTVIASHTPTPWEIHEDWNKTVELFGGNDCDDFKNITHILSFEDAAYIVKAVNCHEELVKLLTEQLTDYEMMDAHRITATDKAWMERARQAIAKAEGGK